MNTASHQCRPAMNEKDRAAPKLDYERSLNKAENMWLISILLFDLALVVILLNNVTRLLAVVPGVLALIFFVHGLVENEMANDMLKAIQR